MPVRLVACSYAHTCLLNPHQRGAMDGINKPAAADCGLMAGPCGGRPRTSYVEGVNAGQNYTFVWQKNLNHWSSTSTSSFTVSIAQDQTSAFHQLYMATDDNSASLTLYTVDIVIPHGYVGVATIQLKYTVSFGVFYQCADVRVLG